jgi:ectoine hydroxylase-related dioxygenase (phytanoyl-CoA dioxygenase family)
MTLSRSELKNNRLSKSSLEQATREFREAGYVVLEGVLPPDWVSTMRGACDRELIRYLKDETRRQRYLVENRGHVGMYPPRIMPFMDPLAIENPFAVQIMKEALGPDFFCTFYNTNTAWPGSTVQRLHRDTHLLFPETPVALPAHTVVVNISLVDFTVENGATELWPGTHLIVDTPEDRNRTFEERASALPSVRATMLAGSVVVRDLRLWHRGMPNRTDTIRTMLAIVYFRHFMQRNDTMTIPEKTWTQMSDQAKTLFRHNPVRRRRNPGI